MFWSLSSSKLSSHDAICFILLVSLYLGKQHRLLNSFWTMHHVLLSLSLTRTSSCRRSWTSRQLLSLCTFPYDPSFLSAHTVSVVMNFLDHRVEWHVLLLDIFNDQSNPLSDLWAFAFVHWAGYWTRRSCPSISSSLSVMTSKTLNLSAAPATTRLPWNHDDNLTFKHNDFNVSKWTYLHI